jgi:hypothetical protein
VAPSLAGDPAILQQAAATQLLMLQAPVPVQLLLGEGVLERLLVLATQLAALYMPYVDNVRLEVPASVMDLSTGHMAFDREYPLPLFSTMVGDGYRAHLTNPFLMCVPLSNMS